MGLRGPKPKGKVKIAWSHDFAYAIGLLVTDGCLSSDGRHILFVSKDKEQVQNYMKALGIRVFVGSTVSGKKKKAFRVQFSDTLFYDFLLGIGLTPAKSLTMKNIHIPDKYFFDFLRGCFDGDGYSYSYWDKRWRSSFMFYIGFASGSKTYVDWFRYTLHRLSGLTGHITKAKRKNVHYQLKYAKQEAVVLSKLMYPRRGGIMLARKHLKIKNALGIVGSRLKSRNSIKQMRRGWRNRRRTTLRW